MDFMDVENPDDQLEGCDITPPPPPPPFSEDENKKGSASPVVDTALDVAYYGPDFIKLAHDGIRQAGDVATAIGEGLAEAGANLMEVGGAALEGLVEAGGNLAEAGGAAAEALAEAGGAVADGFAEVGGAAADNVDILDFLDL